MRDAGYLDKIYKILIGIRDLNAGFPLAICSKIIKSRIGSLNFFTSKKVANQ